MYKDSEEEMNWFVDTCWELVYRQDENGKPVYGSQEALVAAVESGHRIKVRVDGVLHEVRLVQIRNNC